MIVKIALFLLITSTCSLAQQAVEPAPQVNFKDSLLLPGMRDYIRLMELRSGAAKEKTILIIRNVRQGATPKEYRWQLKATGRLDVVQKTIPAFITQIDGYVVLIQYATNVAPLLDYSTVYRESILGSLPASIRNQSADNQPMDPFSTWDVDYEVGKKPSYSLTLHDPALPR